MKRLQCLPVLLFLLPLAGQTNTGDLRLTITDSAGLALKSTVEVVSEANHYRETFETNAEGHLEAKRLPYGIYRVEARREGFTPAASLVEIRSALPKELSLMLSVAEIKTAVTVTDDSTLVDPHRASNVIRLGSDTIDNRQTSLPGRSIIDLVNSQPGWLFEGNAVLHPRGSEYNTQFVIDGIPLTDNRSPSFGPEIEADDVQSLSIYTAGFPAEYGRKLGGVVDIQTARDTRPGFHGDFVASGGSFTTANGYLLGQYSWDRNTLTASVDGATTERYLNPPVVQNFTNTGTTGSFSLRYERDLSDDDRVTMSVTHELSRFEVPNELVQQLAGQRQDRAIFETMGIISYQHIFSPNVVGELRLMSRDDSDSLSSNPLSTPIIAFQNRGFRETYLKGSLTIHKGVNEWKAGFEGDANHLYESFSDVITDFTQFDPGTPASFQFLGRHWDLEQSAYVQDQINLGKWTINAGVRWDHYQLIARKEALSPRIGVARYSKSVDLVLHASYDRVFQTPAFENILVSSSPQVESLNPNFLRLPVPPSLGNYFEVGMTKGFFQKVRLDVNVFDRQVNNYSDDDQLLNTAVSFPIAFAKARLYGTEAKLDLPHWGRLSGYASYSYIVGSAYFPVTGGLFLGQDVAGTLSGVGRFWDSQDQRNTVRARFRYDLTKRVWAAIAGEYGSGLPVAFDGTYADAVAEYGQAVVNRVNLAHGRVRPSLSIDASVGADLVKTEKLKMSVQADVQDLNDRLNVIDFAGLFSGNAIAPSRSYAVRLKMKF
jgi:hypothetical protein